MSTMTLKQIDASIKSIATRGKKLREDAHKTLVGVMEHYQEHGDYTRLKTLTEVVGKALGKSIEQALNQWVAEGVPSLKWDDEAKGFVHIKGCEVTFNTIEKKDKDGKVVFSGDVREYPFYNMEKPQSVKPFNIYESIDTLIKRAEKAVEANTSDKAGNVIVFAQVEELKAMRERMKGLEAAAKEEEAAAKAARKAAREAKEAAETAKILALGEAPKAPKVVNG